MWYLPRIKQNERMRAEILRLQCEVAKEETVAARRKLAIEALRNDPETVERYAREKLGLAKAGEPVIRFEEPDPNAPGRRASCGLAIFFRFATFLHPVFNRLKFYAHCK